ncbi:MAG: hypothetical protein AAF846_17270 [Chloroflexota bacterium]
MPEKTKRKANPRRRTLMRLIIGIGLMIALIGGAIQILRPKGAEIVYIALDQNGIEQVWLVNLNNPDNPRQLTEFDHPMLNVWQLQSASNAPIIVFYTYREDNADVSALWQYDIKRDRITLIQQYPLEDDYSKRPHYNWSLNSSGTQLALTYENHDQSHFLINLHTQEEFEITNSIGNRNSIWVTNDERLILPIERIGDYGMFDELVYASYDVELEQIIGAQFIRTSVWNYPMVSSDGNYYAIPEDTNVGRHLLYGVGIYETDTNELVLREEQNLDDTSFLGQTQIFDWHPSEPTVLVAETWEDIEMGSVSVDLKLYNALSHTEIYLLTDNQRQIYDVTFNHDGTQILISSRNQMTNELFISLVNTETGEETPLPIFGTQPHWVNGGR